MPACTITSQTAHGGIVILGFPQVLIGMLPASRITDMHTCPMVTGIVPHVGGPFILGSMTVLVGMMPQSRVTDTLVCVGPPDVAVMGCETVLVGMAGAGGAGGAMGGISAMGASVPMNAATTSSTQPSSELQGDGTVKTSAPAGGSLPPIPLSSPGFPTLPAKETPNFETAQPVNLPPGTQLYRVIDDPAKAGGSYWSPDPPATEDAWRQTCAVGKWNAGSLLATAKVPAEGLKAWAGTAAAQAGGLMGGGNQLFLDASKLVQGAITQAPWSGAVQQAQQAAQQAMQGAQQAANQAQQAANQAQQQAQQAVNAAQQQAQQAANQAQQAGQQAASQAQQAVNAAQQQAQQSAQQASQAAQQAASQAQQAAQQAQQQAQQAANQAQQAANQAQQQAQQAVGQAKAAAQQAAAQAQQQAQQVQQQAQQATQQAQQAAQQASQAAQQAQQAAQQATQQAQQSAQQAMKGLPKGGL
ncbi:MAG TPA: PAAR domain-containing protein [Terracidiphilus sp.]|nr:PAAR domain-containing protein [Terracidiphilus sp.]